jgi:hypothetical protein
VELKDLLDLHEKLENRVNAYWTYWSVAALAEDAMRFRMELTVVMHLVIDALVIGMLLTAGR